MLIVEKDPRSVTAENYRTLRTNIKYSSFDKENRVITVTSTEPGDGKSTTAANLALAFAQGEEKVLLIDCDLRRPTIHKVFEVSNEIGFTDLMVNKSKLEDVLNQHNKNLSILTSGTLTPNPTELVGSKLMNEFLEDMKKRFDYIIIDTPPLIAVTDAQILATKTDGVLFVIRKGVTKKNKVESAIKLIKQVNGKIIGTILTRVDKKGKYSYY